MNPITKRLINGATQTHVALYRLLKGRGQLGRQMVLVTTIGRKSGKIRTTPLTSVKDGDNYILIASFGGSPKDPDWYRNMQANPNVSIEDHGKIIPTIAETVSDEAEYTRLWSEMMKTWANYDDYQQKTTRRIPVVRLRPVNAA